MTDAERALAVADLRRRLDRLGGRARAASAAPPPRPGAVAAASMREGGPPGSLPPDAEGAVRRLGFRPEPQPQGAAWVRRVAVDLGPFLQRAGAPHPVTGGQLLGLSHGPSTEREPAGYDASACAVLDIETLGLRGSGVVAFLVGLGTPRGDVLEIDQLLLADIGAEPALLGALLGRLAALRLLVTYNGRTFDLPVLRARCVLTRLGGEQLETMPHCDLLSPVRQLFRDRLGVCTLRQTELSLLGFERDGDAPGSEAPERYRAWLQRGDEARLAGVVRHNQLDLCATMVLAARLAAHVEGRLVQPVHPADRYRLAVHLERHGEAELRDEVDTHYRAALAQRRAPWDRHAGHRLARRLARGGAGDRNEAAALLRALWGADPGDLRAARALCILEERRQHLVEALAVADAALATCHRLGAFRLALMRAAPPGGWAADWERRRARLTIRVARRGRSDRPRPEMGLLPGLACATG
ncbi:MAG TPA: ribonuclease H-like domain-containing protein [Candidatus Dormibacteraeota bacterium]